ncbi:MAG: MmcQ/YjbR family DNA-binding protein [Gemmatimonadales bacterium]
MSRRSGSKNHQPHGVRVADARRLLLGLPNIVEGRSYGMPSFLLDGRFFARFRDDDTVLVLQLGTIAEREVLMELDSRAFFFTEHYRNYPAVLIRLAEVPQSLLADVVAEAWQQVATMRAARSRPKSPVSKRPPPNQRMKLPARGRRVKK